MGNSINSFDKKFVKFTVNAILKIKIIKFEEIDNFDKLANFVDHEYPYEKINKIYYISQNLISISNPNVNYYYCYYRKDDLKMFTKIIRKVRKKLNCIKNDAEEYIKCNGGYSVEECNSKKHLIEIGLDELKRNNNINNIDQILKNNNEISQLNQMLISYKTINIILVFFKLTDNFLNLKKRETSNIQLDKHLKNVLKNNNLNFNFKLIFLCKNEVFEYNIDSFILDSSIFDNNLQNEFILEIDQKETGTDFIEYLYTNKIPILALESIERIKSLKSLADFCKINNLAQNCDELLNYF